MGDAVREAEPSRRALAMKSSGGGGDARLLTAILFALHLRLAAGACPCQDPALCKPISSAKDFEVSFPPLPALSWRGKKEFREVHGSGGLSRTGQSVSNESGSLEDF